MVCSNEKRSDIDHAGVSGCSDSSFSPPLQFLMVGSLLKSQLDHLAFPVSGYFHKYA
jgi:hypothetical protein